MSETALQPGTPYETGIFPNDSGVLLRPGGLELTARAVSKCAFVAGARLLDLGCGAGATVECLRRVYGFNAIGVDISNQRAIHTGLKNGSFPFVQARAESLPFASQTMDGVFAECALSLISQRQGVLEECARVLRLQGKFVISDLFPRNASALVCGVSSWTAGRLLEPAELIRELTGLGFSVDLFEDHSDALKRLVIRLLLEYGSLDRLWHCEGVPQDQAAPFAAATRQGRPGYFLLLAHKISN
jgi:SAM-dependent methyltransferase